MYKNGDASYQKILLYEKTLDCMEFQRDSTTTKFAINVI